VGLVGRPDVNVDGPYEDVDNVNTESQAAEPDSEVEDVNDDSHRSTVPAQAKKPPKENLIRSRVETGVELRADESGEGPVMFGHFSTFNSWYEIDSRWEGTFMESVASSAFDRTMVEDRANMKVLYDHGFDPQLGNKPLGPIAELRADPVGAYYEVPLLDTDYNRDFILPALRGQLMDGRRIGSQLGASFRFEVLDEMWDRGPQRSEFNPDALPQRTITRARVLEFGPVTFPASPTASSGARSSVVSGTDRFIHHLHNDPRFLARFTERAGLRIVERSLAQTAADGPDEPIAGNEAMPDAVRLQRRNHLRRRARAALNL
jgi:hypothetical protein